MTEYRQRLKDAEQYLNLCFSYLSKYVMDLGDQLTVSELEQHGLHLEIWDEYSDALKSVAKKQARFPNQAFGAIKKMPLGLVIQFISDNKDLSVLWHFQDGQNRSYPSDLFRQVAGNMIATVEREAECIRRPSLRDHAIQILEKGRSHGLLLANADLEFPFNCPFCGHSLTLFEPLYRAWRDGDIETVNCIACGKEFRDAPFSKCSCVKCKKESGYMPHVMAAHFTHSNTFTCSDCQAAMITDQILSRTLTRGPSVKPEQSGCLILMATLVTSVLIMLSILEF